MKLRTVFLTVLALAAMHSVRAQQGWTTIFDEGVRVAGVLQTSSGGLLIGTENDGLYRSGDDGATFDLVQAFECMEFFISFSETGSGVLYALTDLDLYRSIDDGRSWNRCYLHMDLIPSVNPQSMTVIGDTVLVSSILGIWRSHEGFVWDTVSAQRLRSLIALDNGSVLGMDINGESLMRSTDAGSHWEAIPATLPYAGTFIAGAGSTVFFTYGAVYRSDDWGMHWDVVDAFRYMSGRHGVATRRDGFIVHNVNGTLYTSSDNGFTWALLQQPGACGQAMMYIDRSGRLYADYHVLKLIRTDRTITSAEAEAGPSTLRCDVRPNPSAGEAALEVTMDRPLRVRVSLIDALGREAAVLADGEMEAGVHVVDVRAGTLPSGVYHLLLRAGGTARVKRFVISR